VAVATCAVRAPFCEPELELTGCVREHPCFIPEEILNDTCSEYDVSLCTNTGPGSTCEVACASPHFGTAGLLSCPDNNLDPWKEMDWTVIPRCNLSCSDPSSTPTGFRKTSEGTWDCAAGYVGTAASQCVVDAVVTNEPDGSETVECVARMELLDCQLVVPCAPVSLPQLPEYECRLDVSDCSDVPAGGSCRIGCMLPYFGQDKDASCPVNNTDPNKEVDYTEPSCNLACGRPEPPRVGYEYSDNLLTWSCAEGYTGEASEICEIIEGCLAVPSLEGCALMVKCALPELTDEEACRVDMSLCSDLDAGASCVVSCRDPYLGGDVPGECPEANTDPLQEVAAFCFPGQLCVPPSALSLPRCTCPDPDPIPDGYDRDLLLGTWACSAGWFGEAQAECITDTSDCSGTLLLSGCSQLQSCSINLGFRQECIFNVSDWDPGAGEEFEVSCLDDFLGDTVVGSCPSGNVIEGRDVDWLSNPPHCEADCSTVNPDTLPIGYRKADWRHVRCAPGYHGEAVGKCSVHGDCETTLTYSGCAELQKCKLPDIDPCRYDYSDCMGIGPGESCVVSCREPFRGRPTQAYCDPGNTDENQEMSWTPPECQIHTCSVPDTIPEGFTVSDSGCGWACSDGHVGIPDVRCGAVPAEGCSVRMVFQGCIPARSCQLPPGLADDCAVDWSRCSNIILGSSCTVYCQDPFAGAPAVAQCPMSLDDAEENPVFMDPGISCTSSIALCPFPAELPEGYFRAGSNVRCAVGFSGDVIATCVPVDGVECEFVQNYTGCQRTQPCKLPDVIDVCQHNFSACSDLQAGETCAIHCRGSRTKKCSWDADFALETTPTRTAAFRSPRHLAI